METLNTAAKLTKAEIEAKYAKFKRTPEQMAQINLKKAEAQRVENEARKAWIEESMREEHRVPKAEGKITLQDLKSRLLEFSRWTANKNTSQNSTYESIVEKIYTKEIAPYVVNNTIDTWEADIHNKFMENQFVRFEMSEKQAYCLARAYTKLNPETITF